MGLPDRSATDRDAPACPAPLPPPPQTKPRPDRTQIPAKRHLVYALWLLPRLRG